MGGFVQSAIWLGKEGSNEMTMHRSENVPVITTLAREFALFDRCVRSFYCHIYSLIRTLAVVTSVIRAG